MIYYSPHVGIDIKSAIGTAFQIHGHTSQVVGLVFNGILLEVTAQSTLRAMLDKYYLLLDAEKSIRDLNAEVREYHEKLAMAMLEAARLAQELVNLRDVEDAKPSAPKRSQSGAIIIQHLRSDLSRTGTSFSVATTEHDGKRLCIGEPISARFPMSGARSLRDFLNSIDLDEEATNEKGGEQS